MLVLCAPVSVIVGNKAFWIIGKAGYICLRYKVMQEPWLWNSISIQKYVISNK